MKKISTPLALTGSLSLLTLAWGLNLLYGSGPGNSTGLWLIRAETLNLTGLLAIGLMSLIMLLATRPTWLERPLGGLDQTYRLHKWAGILAISFGILHWLTELSGDLIKASIGRAGKGSRPPGTEFLDMMRDAGKDLGEWALYALIAMLLITLWQRFPYRPWRLLHRAMPILYLMLAFHTAFLAPQGYWNQPIGLLIGLLLLIGSLSSLIALFGQIGRRQQHTATLQSITHPAPGLTQITCTQPPHWPGHKPGQFAFLTLHPKEGPHPFTIASAPSNPLTFQIKALGDYTQKLATPGHLPAQISTLTPGQPVTLEGPYGCFDFTQGKPQQIWIAGGIGITPFLAGLDALNPSNPHPTPHPNSHSGLPQHITLYYCSATPATDPFWHTLKTTCARLPQVHLKLWDSSTQGPLTLQRLLQNLSPNQHHQLQQNKTDLWFCGPQKFGQALRNSLAHHGLQHLTFHQEAFQMR